MENLNEKKQGFDFKKLIEDSKAVLFNPKDYFTKMPVTGGFVEPIIKVLIYGVIIGIFSFMWSLTGLGISDAPSWLGGGVGFMALIGSIIFAVIGLFIGGAIMLIISAIFGGNTDYETNVRVIASIMVIRIISSALGFFDGINLYLSAIVSIIIALWGLYITYQALTLTLKTGEKGTKIFLIVIAIIVVITSFTGIAAKKILQLTKSYNIENLSDKEQQETVMNLVEKMTGGEVKADDLKRAVKEQKKMLKNMLSKKEVEKQAKTTSNSNSKYVKPADFPEKLFADLSDVLSDKSFLNDRTLNNTIEILSELQNINNMKGLSEEAKKIKSDRIIKSFEYYSIDDLMNKSVKPAVLSASILTMANDIDPDEKIGGPFFKDFLSQNPVSLHDLKFTYENWDKVVKLSEPFDK
jgi:hypothetical protein